MMNKTLLKYAGNKKNIMNVIVPYLGSLDDKRRYIEPFCGALGSYCNVDLPDHLDVILGDSNWELINFYQCVLKNPLAVEQIANSWTNNEEIFYNIREWDRDPDWKKIHSPIEIAARTIFLNKYCFNGLFRINKHGYFTTPWGHSKRQSIIKITENKEFLRRLKHAKLFCCDWIQLVTTAGPGDVIYCDPPYIDPNDPNRQFVGYVGSFGWPTQTSLRDELVSAAGRGARVVASNSWCDASIELYRDFNIVSIDAPRSLSSKSQSRGTIKELVVWL